MKNARKLSWFVAIAATTLAGCGSLTNGSAVLPSQTVGNLSTVGKLQLAVGTAHLADGTTGLNVVTTFRQADGLSATLVNTPTISGPSGFIVPNPVPLPTPNGYGGPGIDAGTSSITGITQTASVATPSPAPDTFGVTGGVFASGLEPFNETEGAPAYYPGSPASGAPSPSYGEPFYTESYDGSSTSPLPFLIGPPAVPFFNNGAYPGGFAGYQTGFTAFEAAPVAGTYTLSLLVQASNTKSATYKATATLSSLAILPAIPKPSFTEDGSGGGTATVVVPAGVSETIVYVEDMTAGVYYASGSLTGTGTLTFTLPDTLGACTVKVVGCQNNASQSAPSIASGDSYVVYAAGFDYAQFEAEPPGNKQQTPTITGSNGQADITLSPAYTATY
jgi:hypothetical protein